MRDLTNIGWIHTLLLRMFLAFAIALASGIPMATLAQDEGSTEDAETEPGSEDGPDDESSADDDGADDGTDDDAGAGDDGADDGTDDDAGAGDDGADDGTDDDASAGDDGDDDATDDDAGAGDDGADDDNAPVAPEPSDNAPAQDDGDDLPASEPGAPTTPSDDDTAGDDDSDALDHPRPDQAIVRLRPGVDVDAFADRFGLSVLRSIPSESIFLMALDPERPDEEEVAEIGNDDDVVYAELNFTGQAPEGRRRLFFTSGEGAPVPVDDIGLPAELNLPERSCVAGGGVTVAVLDTGVDADHPFLAESILPDGANIVDETSDVSDSGNGVDDDGDGTVDEMTGHGTHVSGVVIQVAPAAKILPVKVLDSDGIGDTFFVAEGIYYALEQDVDAINLSLGSTFQSRTVTEVVEFATAEGVPVVAAAGNSGVEEPAEYPANDDVAVGIAATDPSGVRADFSNFSTAVDLSAPGVDIASTYPDDRFVSLTGTSAAAPMVTGAIVLLIGQDDSLSPDVILEQLIAGADVIPATDPESDGKVGSGRLNIGASIDCSVRG